VSAMARVGCGMPVTTSAGSDRSVGGTRCYFVCARAGLLFLCRTHRVRQRTKKKERASFFIILHTTFFSFPPFPPPTKHILITMLALRASAASAVTVRPTTANKTMRVWKAENNSEFPPLAGPARRSKESGEKKRMK
jgi:hypothetical protein